MDAGKGEGEKGEEGGGDKYHGGYTDRPSVSWTWFLFLFMLFSFFASVLGSPSRNPGLPS